MLNSVHTANFIFSATAIKVKEETDYIYKFDRYQTVLDFASRPAMPPPVSVLNYLLNAILACCAPIKHWNSEKKRNVTAYRAVKLIERRNPDKYLEETYSYWMNLSKDYFRKKQNEERTKKLAQEQFYKYVLISTDLRYGRFCCF